MKPERIGQNYDIIADSWRVEHQASNYGISQLERAIAFSTTAGAALDVGCGSSNRLLKHMRGAGFQPEGIDISSEMIRAAREGLPDTIFSVLDVRDWIPSKSYRLMTAWDSTFHLPFDDQEPVLKKLCAALEIDGVLLFTCGAPRGEIDGEFSGMRFGYSSLGVNGFMQILIDSSCEVLHVEHDQHPLDHVAVIAKRRK